ncbi:hypothetical protein CB0940_07196 [Cercospora beticola]|uniref:Uncharacterized protein n=1 Tax=Cercospora beticola TaxID=122368 RepID=A0A2G5H867_CERBT|nr:hypothetical protein CB0940_07196 [Cercospora beticola]PIA88734.1 hypothetical protein CB0940_07196 [Cercospora beticola]
MASMAASARAAHLDAASQALLASSPAVSAYLQTQRTENLTTSNKDSSIQACLSCGSLLIAGWNASLVRTSKRTRQDRLAGNTSKSCKIKCSPCGTTQDMRLKSTEKISTKSHKPILHPTAQPKVQRNPIHSHPRAQSTPGPNDASAQASPLPAEEPVEASSKKRSRNKKSTNNLQAMLANRKATTNPRNTGFGLGLGDFIK